MCNLRKIDYINIIIKKMDCESLARHYFNVNWKKMFNGVYGTMPFISQEQLISGFMMGLCYGDVSYYKKSIGAIRPVKDGEYMDYINCKNPNEKTRLSFSEAFERFYKEDGSLLIPEYKGKVIEQEKGLIMPINFTNSEFSKDDYYKKNNEILKMDNWLILNFNKPDEVYCVPDDDIKNGKIILMEKVENTEWYYEKYRLTNELYCHGYWTG